MFNAELLTNSREVRKVRQWVHRQLIETVASDDHGSESPTEIRNRIAEIIAELEQGAGIQLNQGEATRIEYEIMEEIDGMGPLAPLMLDAEITDVLVNGPSEVWVDKNGKLKLTDISFDDQAHLRRFVDRIADAHGRSVDSLSPMLDVRLNDGSRVHAIVPPLCTAGPVVSIRRFRVNSSISGEDYQAGFAHPAMTALLEAVVMSRQNIIVAGGAGAGKTTLLNNLASHVPATERIVTIEETAELQLRHPHVVSLESRPDNSENRGSVSLRELVRTALRMRADRIIVGEVRGPEVWEMLQAMNIGHDGSLTTIHANSPGDVVRRLETLSLMADIGYTRDSIREMIAASIHIIVQLCRFADGSRRIVGVSEIVERDGQPTVVELFGFRPTFGEDGVVSGDFYYTGAKPECLRRMSERGYNTTEVDRILRSSFEVMS